LQEILFQFLMRAMRGTNRAVIPLSRATQELPGVATGRPDEGVGGFPTLKAFAVLETVARSERSLGVSDLSLLLSVPKPTVHRIMRMLESEGLLQREPGTRGFVPGARLLGLGLSIVAASVRTAPRRAILEALSREIGETCNFGVLAGNDVVYLDRVEAAWPLGLRFEAGSRVPVHCTSMGKLLLSFLPAQRRLQMLRAAPLNFYTENTITDPVRLNAELDAIRVSQVSIDNQEFLAGVVCAAVPVRGPNGAVAAALAVSAPMARMSVKRAEQCVPLLRAAAERLTETLLHEASPAARGE
jgi:IclR family acetate operon transcriptional repressor